MPDNGPLRFQFETEAEFRERFPSEKACRQFFKRVKWPNGFVCRKCGHTHGKRIAHRKEYYCRRCFDQQSLIAGTVLENTKLSFRKWFWAVFYLQKGITGAKLGRRLEISKSAALHLGHRIRKGMKTQDPIANVCHQTVHTTDPVPFSDAMDNRAWCAAGRPNEPLVGVAGADGKIAMQVLEYPNSTPKAENEDAAPESKPMPESGSAPNLPAATLMAVTEAKSWLRSLYRGTVGRHLQRYLDEYCYRRNRYEERPQLFDLTVKGCVRATPLRRRELFDFRGWLEAHRVAAPPPPEGVPAASPMPA